MKSLVLSAASLCLCALLFNGCSSSFDPLANPGPIASAAINGHALGGRQPIVGAHIYLLQANDTAYAGPGIAASSANASTSLLTSGDGTDSHGTYVLTGNDGGFNISGDYTCTAGDQVYLYSSGGDTGAHVNNTSAGLLAILGTCGTDFNSSTTVNLNEVSTIAAAFAFSGFATDATHVGAPSSTNTLAATGIRNAFATASLLFDISSNPFSSHDTPARSTTPAGNGTVPQGQIDLLANILSGCVNSSGPTSSQCTNLLTGGRSNGGSGNVPADTATEAIYIAHNPWNIGIWGTNGTSNPYIPYNSGFPNDFTLQLSFTGGGLGAMRSQPQALAVDANGYLWAAPGYNSAGNPNNVLSEFTPLGVPVVAGGISGIGLSNPFSVAIDAGSNYVWVGNFGGNNLVGYKIADGSHKAYSTGNGSGPLTLGIDGSGYLWSTTLFGNLLKVNAADGTTTTTTGNGLNFPEGVALEPGAAGNVWVADLNGTASLFDNTGAAISNPSVASNPLDVVIDASGNAWFGDDYSPEVHVASADGTSSISFYPGYGSAQIPSMAVDGANHVWIATSGSNESPARTADDGINEYNAAGTRLNSSSYTIAPAVGPSSLAIDGSGNLWFTTEDDATLREMVGVATPVATPIAYGVANNKLGARP